MQTIEAYPGRIRDAKRAIKAAAKAGGHYRIESYMPPPNAGDVVKLLDLAAGHIEEYHWPGGRQLLSVPRISAMPAFKPFPEYEARMIEWADAAIMREEERERQWREDFEARNAHLLADEAVAA